MKTHIIASLAVASTALAGTIDGPGMLTNVPGSLKPMLAHWPTPASTLGAGAPWGFPGLPSSPMAPNIILGLAGVCTYDYVNTARTVTRDLGMCWNSAGGPIPPSANPPSSPAVTWTGFGTGPAVRFAPIGPSLYPGAIPFHNDGPNAGGGIAARYTPGAIPNVIAFPSRAVAAPFAGSDEAEFTYAPVNGLPMLLDLVEVENLTYRKFTSTTGATSVLIEACSVYRNGLRIATFLHQTVPAATRATFNALHPGVLVGPTGPAVPTLRTPPLPNAFTLGRFAPGIVVIPGDRIVVRYDDFGYNTDALDNITTVIPVPPNNKNGNGWALSAISGHQ